jgi:hypothetical protein
LGFCAPPPTDDTNYPFDEIGRNVARGRRAQRGQRSIVHTQNWLDQRVAMHSFGMEGECSCEKERIVMRIIYFVNVFT